MPTGDYPFREIQKHGFCRSCEYGCCFKHLGPVTREEAVEMLRYVVESMRGAAIQNLALDEAEKLLKRVDNVV